MKHARFLRRTIPALATVIAAGALGLQLRDWTFSTARAGKATVLPDLDFFVRPRSFSEIETTRAELEGLALRFRTETRARHLGLDRKNPADRHTVIAELERGIAEFKETPEELFLVQDLLLLLRAEGQNDRWLDVYLDILYRRPTQDLLATFLDTAQRLAQATSRESEVESGFRHLLQIPFDFPAKRLLQDLHAHAALQPNRTPATGPVL
ncbi:MAG: hypothetical protein J0M24_17460 [Verrucomicrobia bacterium]|nr:hypothetical protein [Verrucomicrobiota bacterium]